MNETQLARSGEIAEIVARERAAALEGLRDLVAQDVAFLARAMDEGFDARTSVRLALTPDTTEDGRPILAVEGSVEGLPDQIFPRLNKGYTVRYQAAIRGPALEAANESPPALSEPSPDAEPVPGGG